MDQTKIETFLDRYRSLSPEAIAALDEDRHQLMGEEAVALDRVMCEPARKQQIEVAIGRLDLMKRRSFRLFIVEFLIYVALTVSITVFESADGAKAYAFLWLAIILYALLLRPRMLLLMAKDPVSGSASAGRS